MFNSNSNSNSTRPRIATPPSRRLAAALVSLSALAVTQLAPVDAWACANEWEGPCEFLGVPYCNIDLTLSDGVCRSYGDVITESLNTVSGAAAGGGKAVAGAAIDVGNGMTGFATDAVAFADRLPALSADVMSTFRAWDCGNMTRDEVSNLFQKYIPMPDFGLPAPYHGVSDFPEVCAGEFTAGLVCNLPSLLQDNAEFVYGVMEEANGPECSDAPANEKVVCGLANHLFGGIESALQCSAGGIQNGAFFGLSGDTDYGNAIPDAAINAAREYVGVRCNLAGESIIDGLITVASGGSAAPAIATKVVTKLAKATSQAQQVVQRLNESGSCGSVDSDLKSAMGSTELPSRIALMSHTGHFLRSSGHQLDLHETTPDRDNTFTVVPLADGKIALQGHDGNYVNAWWGGNSGVAADADIIRWETELKPVKDGTNGVAFQTSDGTHFLRANNGGGGSLDSHASAASSWERFTIINMDRRGVMLRHASSNKSLEFFGDGAASSQAKRYDFSQLIMHSLGGDKVAFQDLYGNFISANNGGGGLLQWNVRNLDIWETFEMVDAGDGTVAFRTWDGQHYLSIWGMNGGVGAHGTEIADAESFYLVDTAGEDVRLKAPNGKWVCAESGGNNVLVADRDVASIWETFRMIKAPNGDVLLQAHDGRYVNANGNTAGAWADYNDGIEFLHMVPVKGGVRLQVKNGGYLRLEGTDLYFDALEGVATIFKLESV